MVNKVSIPCIECKFDYSDDNIIKMGDLLNSDFNIIGDKIFLEIGYHRLLFNAKDLLDAINFLAMGLNGKSKAISLEDLFQEDRVLFKDINKIGEKLKYQKDINRIANGETCPNCTHAENAVCYVKEGESKEVGDFYSCDEFSK